MVCIAGRVLLHTYILHTLWTTARAPGLLLSCLHLFLACHQERVDVLEPFKLSLVNASYHFPRRREEAGRGQVRGGEEGGQVRGGEEGGEEGGRERGDQGGGGWSVEGDTAASLPALTYNSQLFGVTLLTHSHHFSLTPPLPHLPLTPPLPHLSLTGHQE